MQSIETLKTRAIALGTSVKKGELLRAGLMALQAATDVGELPRVSVRAAIRMHECPCSAWPSAARSLHYLPPELPALLATVADRFPALR